MNFFLQYRWKFLFFNRQDSKTISFAIPSKLRTSVSVKKLDDSQGDFSFSFLAFQPLALSYFFCLLVYLRLSLFSIIFIALSGIRYIGNRKCKNESSDFKRISKTTSLTTNSICQFAEYIGANEKRPGFKTREFLTISLFKRLLNR
jgi:hypothetical protein